MPGVSDTYELLSAGNGRRLERFGAYVLDRPCTPCLDPANGPPLPIDASYNADAPTGHRWAGPNVPGDRWTAVLDGLSFELGLTDAGQVGLYPEQLASWRWIERRVRALRAEKPAVLNLFAHTGGSTLAAARAGAAVVHVDASRTSVAWARRNAGLSNLAEAPIRWIVDDAQAFMAREIRRGHRYDGVIVDPPTYGHGPKGQPWRLAHDLPVLLAGCAAVLREGEAFLHVTAHTTGLEPAQLADLVAETVARGGPAIDIDVGPMEIRTADGRAIHLGAYARWAR